MTRRRLTKTRQQQAFLHSVTNDSMGPLLTPEGNRHMFRIKTELK